MNTKLITTAATTIAALALLTACGSTNDTPVIDTPTTPIVDTPAIPDTPSTPADPYEGMTAQQKEDAIYAEAVAEHARWEIWDQSSNTTAFYEEGGAYADCSGYLITDLMQGDTFYAFEVWYNDDKTAVNQIICVSVDDVEAADAYIAETGWMLHPEWKLND